MHVNRSDALFALGLLLCDVVLIAISCVALLVGRSAAATGAASLKAASVAGFLTVLSGIGTVLFFAEMTADGRRRGEIPPFGLTFLEIAGGVVAVVGIVAALKSLKSRPA